MARALVIVESVAKATRIQGMLGPDYIVKPSIGHVRDLPQSAAEIPASVKGEKWARLGINVNDHFKPVYVVRATARRSSPSSRRHSRRSTSSTSRPTRTARARPSPGTSTSCSTPRCRSSGWSSTRSPPRRSNGPSNDTRDLDLRLVDAQEGRRFLDRLVGYEVSPVLWRAVDKARSAGRVQSVAIRLVCERERERMAFRSATWFDVTATLDARAGAFEATLDTVNGVALATGKHFDAEGRLDAAAGGGVERRDGRVSRAAPRRARTSRWPRSPRRRAPSAPSRPS